MISARMRSAIRALHRWRVALAVVLSIGAVMAGAGASFAAGGPVTGPVTGYLGLCLDDPGFGTQWGTPVQIWNCNGGSNQQWTVTTPQFGGNTTITIYGLCLDVQGSGTANGTPVQLWGCNGTGAQEWTLGWDGTWVNVNSGKCLDDPAFGGAGTRLQIWDCNHGNNQVWNIVGFPTG